MSKTVVLTGGASGIGGAVLERLVAAGHEVHVLDVRSPQTEPASFQACDLSNPGDVSLAIETLQQRRPKAIDALVNVAGVATMANETHTVAINFLALRMLTEALLVDMQAGGSVVNVASTAGWKWRDFIADITPLLNTPNYASGQRWLVENPDVWRDAPYHFSKRCAAAYTYRAAQLALPRGVRVNCVNPGVTETRLSPEFRGLVGEALYDWGVDQIGRPGTPEDIAEVIDYLATGDCRWLNGQEIVVDGGYIAGLIGGWIDPSKAPA